MQCHADFSAKTETLVILFEKTINFLSAKRIFTDEMTEKIRTQAKHESGFV